MVEVEVCSCSFVQMKIKSRMQPEVWSSSMNLLWSMFSNAVHYKLCQAETLEIHPQPVSFGMKQINAIKIAP